MKTSNGARGFTLLECIVAVGLLAIGGLATARLIGVLYGSSDTVSGVTDGTSLATTLMSEIAQARYQPGTTDPGLAIGYHAAPVGGSQIQSLGSPSLINGAYQVSYEVQSCVLCNNPYAMGVNLGGLEVVVTVQNNPPYTHLRAPLNFYLRKETQATLVAAGQQRF
jgi:prepilin-type N-terminal cleavage/methylation domain-containing protein